MQHFLFFFNVWNMNFKEFWEKNGQPLAGSAALLAVYAVVAWSCFGGEPDNPKDPKKETAKESTTLRQDASAMWHRAKCAVRFCDEDGRCPVWSSKYSKCYMMDREGERVLRYYEREGARKEQIESWSPDLFGK